MNKGLEDLIGEENLKRLETETINDLPIIEKGQVLLKEKIIQSDSQNKEELIDNDLGDSDEFLSGVLQKLKTRTIVIGVGGAGNNAISRLQESGSVGAITMAVNTDAQDLFYANSDQKLLIGKELTGGFGAGNNPEVGEKAAESDLERIQKILNKNIVFITLGLGGGTGTGAGPIIAREAKKLGAMVITFCTLPFTMEGENKRIIANKGLAKLAKYSDTIIPLPNDNLLNLVPNLTMMKGFKIMDEILIRCVRGIVDVVSNCGVINLDLADVKSIFLNNQTRTGFIGMSEISVENISERDENGDFQISMEEFNKRLQKKTIEALNNPLLDSEPSQITACLVSIIGNHYLTLSQVNEIVSVVSKNIDPAAKIKMGAMIDPHSHSIKINILGHGKDSSLLLQTEHISENTP